MSARTGDTQRTDNTITEGPSHKPSPWNLSSSFPLPLPHASGSLSPVHFVVLFPVQSDTHSFLPAPSINSELHDSHTVFEGVSGENPPPLFFRSEDTLGGAFLLPPPGKASRWSPFTQFFCSCQTYPFSVPT